ncbi:hypothetical protein J6590_012720 [Homalodisca vitripennis]|nr:hypothetical protein J6590_012720 [Homalodisca vitripennis]
MAGSLLQECVSVISCVKETRPQQVGTSAAPLSRVTHILHTGSQSAILDVKSLGRKHLGSLRHSREAEPWPDKKRANLFQFRGGCESGRAWNVTGRDSTGQHSGRGRIAQPQGRSFLSAHA